MAKWNPKGTGQSNQAVATSKLQGDVGSFQVGGIRPPVANRGIMLAIPDPAQQQVPSQALAQIAQPQGGYAARPVRQQQVLPSMGTPPAAGFNRALQAAPSMNPYATLATGYRPQAQGGGGGGGQGGTESFGSALTDTPQNVEVYDPAPRPAEAEPANLGNQDIVWGGSGAGQSSTTETSTTTTEPGAVDPEFKDAYDQASASIDASVNQQRERELYEARRMGYGPGMLAQIDAEANISLQQQKNTLWLQYMQAWWSKQASDKSLSLEERRLDDEMSKWYDSFMSNADAMRDDIDASGATPAQKNEWNKMVADIQREYADDPIGGAAALQRAKAEMNLSVGSNISNLSYQELVDLMARAKKNGVSAEEQARSEGFDV